MLNSKKEIPATKKTVRKRTQSEVTKTNKKKETKIGKSNGNENVIRNTN